MNDDPTSPSRRSWRVWTALGVVLALTFAVYASSARHFFMRYWVDDAAISFTFARNIADGYGSVAFPGGERVEGFSNPTWVALLATTHVFGADPFTVSQILGLLLALGVFVLLACYGATPFPDKRGMPWPVALGGLLVAGNAGYAIWNQSGMENSLYLFLMTLAMVLVVRESRLRQGFCWSAVVLAALAITRPEGLGHAVIAGGFLLLTELIQQHRPTRRLLVWLGVLLGLVGLYHVWHYIYFARPFPNTYYAKVTPALTDRLFSLHGRGWRYAMSYLDAYGFWPLLVMALPALAGRRVWREALYFAATGAFLLFFTLVSDGDWMRSWRFLSGFPIILALLLGLAAFNLSRLLARPVGRFAKGSAATAVLVAIAAAWVVAPAAATYGKSLTQLDTFLEDREVSAKGIARRARWWTMIADKLALRPDDTMMTDMDMGGTTYNWPGRIMDIGYLLSVPMAAHHYTRHWPRMMDEHFYDEMRPEFIHIRRGWGRATTIPTNPKFRREYVVLPDDKKFSRSFPNGNYVRRDLFERTKPPAVPWEPITFAAGLTLHAVEVPAAFRPHEKTPVFLTWSRGPDAPPRCQFLIGFARRDDPPRLDDYRPLMGWLQPGDWSTERFTREVATLRTPRTEDTYRLFVGIETPDGEREVREVPVPIIVGARAAEEAANRLLDEAAGLAKADAVSADRAPKLLREAEQIVGAKAVAREVRSIDLTRLATYLKGAQQAINESNYAAAAHLLSRGWRIDARDKRLRKLGWLVAGKLYETGRQDQIQGDYESAFRMFDTACKAQPQHAWARQRAEQVRALRY